MSIKTLPPTSELLTMGGDTRIVPDPQTGLTVYGCQAFPDPYLVALGSSTASSISVVGYQAADALRSMCIDSLQSRSDTDVYATQTNRLRQRLLASCGVNADNGIEAVFAASGTDLHLLIAQWLKPQRIVMIKPAETGSGVSSALEGKHFNRLSACGGKVPLGGFLGDWHGDLSTVSARTPDGSLRPPADVDDECRSLVRAAIDAGQQVLLILNDVSKTSLIVPSIELAVSLKHRWPQQVNVLVDGCQFRLSTETVRAYLAQDFVVALTGSKFISGPTFCGALLVPHTIAQRYSNDSLSEGARLYSNAADWPANWPIAQSLPTGTNFGLLLRWEAALAEFQRFIDVPTAFVKTFLQQFGQALQEYCLHQPMIELLPISSLRRDAISIHDSWDEQQTIFPFALRKGTTSSAPYLTIAETETVYRQLRTASGDDHQPRYQLGQPVICLTRNDAPVSALRLCISAPMIVQAYEEGANTSTALRHALAALERAKVIVNALP